MNLCRSCGRDFASLAAFDKHRMGVHAYTLRQGLGMNPPREDGRRCLYEHEFGDVGLGLDGRGRWQLVAAAERVRERFAGRPESAAGVAQEATEGVEAPCERAAA